MNFRPVLLAYVSLFVFAVLDNVRGPLYPKILSFYDISPSVGSNFFFFAALGALFSQFFTFYWMPRLGSVKKSLDFANFVLLVSILSFAGCGFLKLHVSILFAACFVFGCAMGMTAICQNSLVSIGSTGCHRNRVFSGLHAIYGIGSLLAPLVVGWTLGHLAWWQIYFALTSMFLLVFPCSFVLRSDIGEGEQRFGKDSRERLPLQFLFGLALGFAVMCEILVSSRMVYLLQKTYDYTVAESATQLTVFFCGLTLGRLLFAVFDIPLRSLSVLFLSSVLSSVCIFLSIFWDISLLPLSGLFVGPFFPAMMTVVNQEFEGHFSAVSSRVFVVMGFGVMAMHPIMGLMADRFGVLHAFSMSVVYGALSFFLLLFYRVFFEKRTISSV